MVGGWGNGGGFEGVGGRELAGSLCIWGEGFVDSGFWVKWRELVVSILALIRVLGNDAVYIYVNKGLAGACYWNVVQRGRCSVAPQLLSRYRATPYERGRGKVFTGFFTRLSF